MLTALSAQPVYAAVLVCFMLQFTLPLHMVHMAVVA